MDKKRPNSARSKVLVVDDILENLQLLSNLLSKRGYIVEIALSGAIALDIIPSFQPDLILLDILMPTMNGYQVCQRLKANTQTCHIPVIFLSAGRELVDPTEAFAVGGSDFIAKPFQIGDVLVRVEHQLQLVILQRELSQQREQLIQQNQRLQQEIEERQRIEDELAQERAFLQCLIDSIPDFIFYKDQHGVYLACNRAFTEFVGRPKQDIIGCTDVDLFPTLSADVLSDRDRQVLLHQQPQHYEEWATCPDGRPILLDTLKTPFFSVERDILGLIGICREITDRRQSEDQLRRMSSRLLTLIANLHAGVLVEDEQRRIVLANQTFCDLFQIFLSPDELIGLDCALMATQCVALFAEPATFAQRIEDILQERQIVVAEEILLADGRIFERDYVPIQAGHDDLGHLWQYRDITARKMAEAEMQYQLQRTLLLQQITEAIRSQIEPQQIFEVTVTQIARAFQVSRCLLHTYVADPIPDIPWVAEYVEPGWESLMGGEIPIEGNPHAVQVLAQDQAVVSANVYTDPLLAPLRSICEAMHLKSMLAVRTSYQGEPNGIIGVHQCDRFRDWTTDEIALIEAIAAQVGIAFAQVQLLEQETKQREALDYQNSILREEICHRKQLERQLSQSQQFLNTIVENIPLALFVKDVADQFRYVLWNRTAELMYGVPREQVIGQVGYKQDWITPELAERFSVEDQNVISQKKPLLIVEAICRPPGSGNIMHQRMIKVPLISEQHQVTHILCIAEDITERKRQEDEMQRAREAADAANRAKSQFLANISHELRTPLNTILGFTQLITEECKLELLAAEYLNIINRSGEHLLNLINDVLEMSKIEAGQTALSIESFNLCHFLNSLEEMLRFRAEAKGLSLTFDLASNLPAHVQTDERKLRQVLINLLGNAIKFTHQGSVRLRVNLENQENLHSSPPSQLNHRLFFQVEDTGPGIAPHDLETLFDPFVQTSTGRQSPEGTGLGLSISRHFVRLMGGEIDVDSVVGQGSLFTFYIQVNLTVASGAGNQPSSQKIVGLAPGQPNYRILVVEDHRTNRRLLVRLLEVVGFDVKEAVNGQEAIALAREWHPHLIWMDIRMPIMNGYEATRQIKAANLNPPPVVIALTASAFEEDRARVIAAGCDDFVRKPFRREVLLGKIADYLQVRYRYEGDVFSTKPNSSEWSYPNQETSPQTSLSPVSLDRMPPEWIDQLQWAAIKGSDQQILQLIQEIPPTYSQLRQSLIYWADGYQFDKIIDFIQSTSLCSSQGQGDA
jgi:two-component system sensor histidine kinase/response regulator